MKIVEIRNIERKDVPIYYRRLYSGTAVLELMSKPIETRLDFQIEQKPTGHSEIGITLSDKIDYPLVPLHKELKNFIGALDTDGKLPL
ncbi:MAG: hypothetical protein FWH35_08830 [Treponema sp.]|nr:hypothetical protein [Treponema sp.]MCL2130443.1 hypothetical protein [Treponema sp.]